MENAMLPRASVANKCLRIKGKTDVSEVRVIVPVSGEVMPFVIIVDETADTSRN
jgi:hypothetical protein